MQGGGQAGGVHQGQEAGEVPGLEGVRLLGGPAVIAVEMQGAKHRPVAALPPQGGDGGAEVRLGHVPQHFFSEVGRHRPHLPGDGGVVVRQVAVAGAGVYNAKGVAGLAEVVVHPLHDGVGGVVEVDGYRAPHRRAHLVHQAAGFAEVDVFRVLADLGDGDGVKFTIAAETVEHAAHQGLVGGGGGKPGAGQHSGGGIGVEAGQGIAQLLDFRRNPPHQGGGGVLLLPVRGQVV